MTTKKKTPAKKHPYVIIRSDRAGVFAGELVSKKDTEVTLNACRRLWYWKCKSGIALSGVAMSGLASDCKLDSETQGHMITGVLEVIPCSVTGEASIRAYK